MANGAFKFKDNSGNVVSFISGSGSDIVISGGTLNLSGMTGLTLGNLTMSGTTQNAISASHAASYLLTSSFNSYTGTTNTIIGSLQTSTGSLNSFTSSTDSRLTSIETSTSSLNSYTSSNNTRLGVIESTTSSLNTYTSSTNTRLGVIESTTGSLNTFTSSANERLNSIEGKTGSYATTGSNTFNGNLTVTGYIDAQELRTTYISSSILYRSGSTKFGDELTDTHAFTGSVLISGSLSVPGQNLTTGTGNGVSSQIVYFTGNNTIDGVSSFVWNNPNFVIGLSEASNNTDYKVLLQRHGTLANPGTWTNSVGLQIVDYAADGPASFQATGLVSIELPRIATNDTNAGNAVAFRVANDNLTMVAVKGNGNIHLGQNGSSDTGERLQVNGSGKFSDALTVATTGTFGFQDYRTQTTQKVLVLNGEGVSGQYSPSLFNVYTKPGTTANGIASIIIKSKYGSDAESGNLFEFKGNGDAAFSGAITAATLTTIGTAAAGQNVQLNLNGVSGKAQRIEFQNSGTQQWLMGVGAASETTAFEIYNSAGAISLSINKSTNQATFISSVRSKGMSVDGTNGAGFLAQLDGNNTAANGAYFGFVNAANSRYFINQLDTNNDINYYYFNGSSWSSSLIKLSNTGGANFTGNVSIGTINNPTFKLLVRETVLFTNSGTDGGASYVGSQPILTVTTDGNGTVSGAYASNAVFRVGIGGGDTGNVTTEWFRINLNGSVGIGTSNSSVGGAPGNTNSKLNILSSSGSSAWAQQIRHDSTTGNGLFLRAGNSSSYWTAYFTGYDESKVHLAVRGDGRIGIGTNGPLGTLHVTTSGTTASAPSLGWPAYNSEADTNSRSLYFDTSGNGNISTAGYGGTISLILGQYYDSRAVITTAGSGGASPGDQGTGHGKDLLIKGGTSDNGNGYRGGRLYLNGGAGYQGGYGSNVGDIFMQSIGSGGMVIIGSQYKNDSSSLLQLGSLSNTGGGHLFKKASITSGTATTFFTTNNIDGWCGVVEVFGVCDQDRNRVFYKLARFAYNRVFTEMISSEQNTATTSFTYSGNNLQINIGGSSGLGYYCMIRIMGSTL